MSYLRSTVLLLIAMIGVLSALALPFAPVLASQTMLTWPADNAAVASSSAVFAPYRPAELTATVPCAALRAGMAGSATIVATSDAGGAGLIVRAGPDGARLVLGDRVVELPLPSTATPCTVTILAGPQGVSITQADGSVTVLAGEGVPEVFGFHTELSARQAEGMSVTATVDSPFGTSPSTRKRLLIGLQLLAAAAALALLRRRRGVRRSMAPRVRWRATLFVDAGVIGILGLWAVIGPLAVDDGWSTMIARNVAATGNPGNYYRWWNASEVPFALGQQLLAPLTDISLAPLWLRLPSTALAVATWLVLSRGVLRAAMPSLAATGRLRLLAALFFLLAWLPFNLGTRPESYVAFGVTTVLWLLWRSSTPAGIGLAVLVAALTIPISPTAIIVAAPFLVFAPRVVTILRQGAPARLDVAAQAGLLGAIGAVALTAIFADETWAALVTATDWHRFFGPSLPWYDEIDRYRYLLGDDQQGSFAKRAPILLAVAMLPVVAFLQWRTRRDGLRRSALRLSVVLVLSLLLLALSPSKWSYHLGSIAGVVSAFLVTAVVLVARRSGSKRVAGAAGGALLAGAAALSFAGDNVWWLPAVYDVPFATGAWRPLGIGFVVVLAVSVLACRRAAASAPAIVAVSAALVVVVFLVGSFALAPVRRSAGSLTVANVHRVSGGPVCGLADDIEVLPDGAPLVSADLGGQLDGFTAGGGFFPGAPPPDPPGTGASASLWGSWSNTPQHSGTLVSPWFSLPPLGVRDGLAVSVSGRIDDGNSLHFEFGRTAVGGIETVGDGVAPVDRVAPDENPEHPLWRSIGIDSAQVTPGADRVRLRAVDGRTDRDGWLAVTGPRLRSVVPLNDFLTAHGPVLIGWPIAFLFPCLRDIPVVSGGLAQTPGAVIAGPRPRFDEERDRGIGGTFAELDVFGQLGEIPTRLVGHPDVDWGALFVSFDPTARDTYQRSIIRVPRSGLDTTGRERPQR